MTIDRRYRLPESSLRAYQRRAAELFLFLLLLFSGVLTATGQTIEFTSSPYGPDEEEVSTYQWWYYVHDIDAKASDGSEVRYSLRFGPEGMVVQSESGIVLWYPARASVVDIEVRAELVTNPAIYATQQWQIRVQKLSAHHFCTGKEIWLPLGEGVPGWAIGSPVVMNDELYGLHLASDNETGPLYLSKWDGERWSTVTTLESHVDTGLVEAHAHASPMVVYRNHLYIHDQPRNNFNPKAGASDLERLMMWDGASWSEIDINGFRHIYDMDVHNDGLYVFGFQQIEDQFYHTIAIWNEEEWVTVFQKLSAKDYPVFQHGTNNLVPIGDVLYCWGNTIIDDETVVLGKLVDGAIEPLENVPDNLKAVGAYEEGLVLGTSTAASRGETWFWREGLLEKIPTPPSLIWYYIEASYFNSAGGELYLNGAGLWRYNGESWQPISITTDTSPPSTPVLNPYTSATLTDYKGKVILYGNFDESCGNKLSNAAYLCSDDECSRIVGSVYHDRNRNCVRDPGEPGLPLQRVKAETGRSDFTDDRGEFTILVPPGTHSLTFKTKDNWTATCSDPQEAVVPLPGDVAGGFAFGVDSAQGASSVTSESVSTHLLQISPNPAGEITQISFTLDQREEVTLCLIDARGKVIHELLDKALEAGPHYIELETHELASGAFFLLIERDGEREITPLIINKE